MCNKSNVDQDWILAVHQIWQKNKVMCNQNREPIVVFRLSIMTKIAGSAESAKMLNLWIKMLWSTVSRINTLLKYIKYIILTWLPLSSFCSYRWKCLSKVTEYRNWVSISLEAPLLNTGRISTWPFPTLSNTNKHRRVVAQNQSANTTVTRSKGIFIPPTEI